MSLLLAAAVIGALSLAAPAVGQSSYSIDNRVQRLVVYGDESCPKSTTDEVVVCARRTNPDEYRLPEEARAPDDPAADAESWAFEANALEMEGNSGTMSCSPTGPGGASGCLQQFIAEAQNQGLLKTLSR
jgi:hypothetical protein